jgi:hypothetical protein
LSKQLLVLLNNCNCNSNCNCRVCIERFLKLWQKPVKKWPDLPPGLDFVKTVAFIIEQLQLQLQLQLQGLHGAFCNTMAKT